MPDLRDLLEGAVDRPAPLDMGDLARRVARHERHRRLAVTAAAAVIFLVGVTAAAMAARSDGPDVDVPIPPSGDSTVATAPDTSTTAPPSSSTSATTATGTSGELPSASSATVPGGPGGAPPCAESLVGQEGAGVEHPERAPLRGNETFAGGVRWAVCGAGVEFPDAILNLRSDDGGQNWSVTETGLSLLAFHAGDDVQVELTSATTGRIHLVSLVGERDELYETDDGGLTWRLVG